MMIFFNLKHVVTRESVCGLVAKVMHVVWKIAGSKLEQKIIRRY